MQERWLRIRAFLDANARALVVGLVVLGAVGGLLTYTAYAAPDTETERRPTAEWSTVGEFGHAATVVRDTTVYAEGERLPNRSRYFTSVAPELDVSHSFRYTASDGGRLNVTAETRLVIHSVTEADAGTGTVEHWRVSQQLNETRRTGVAPGDRVTASASVNVTRLVNRTREIRSELGGELGTVEALVERTVTVRGTVNGRPVERTVRYSMTVAPADDVYTVENPGTQTASYRSTRTVEVTKSYGPLRRVLAPFAAAGAALGVAAIAAGRRADAIALSSAERESLAYLEDRNDFGEWINTVELPAEALEYPRAEAESLADLADLAIDAEAPLVEDPSRGRYYVVHRDVLYTYEPPAIATGWEAIGEADGEGGAGDPLETEAAATGETESGGSMDATVTDADGVDDTRSIFGLAEDLESDESGSDDETGPSEDGSTDGPGEHASDDPDQGR
ncbi:MAG: DUF5305 domain-containing protein [Halobacteriales archaeon]